MANLESAALDGRPRRQAVAIVAVMLATVALAACGTRLEREELLGGGTAASATEGGATAVDPATGAVTDSGSGSAQPDATGGESGAGVGGASDVDDGDATDPSDAGAQGSLAPGQPAPGQRAATASGDLPTGPDAAIFGGGKCTKPTLSPIQLGNVSTLSGVLGQLFAPAVPALQTFVKAQNECGGLNGHPIKLIIADDQGDPSTARTVATRLIRNDKIVGFVGNIQVLTIDAMVSIVEEYKIPVIGGDITSNTWFINQFIFPQGPPVQASGYALLEITAETLAKKKLGHVYCAEVPKACDQLDRAIKELAPKLGVEVVTSARVSISSPSYQAQCAELQRNGAEVVATAIGSDAFVRLAKDCDKLNYRPEYIAYSITVGNENLFLGNERLGGTLLPLPNFGWMASETPAEKFYQASVKKFNPGFPTGNAASLGWSAGALAVAASSRIGNTPTSQQLLDGLYAIKDNNLGGLSPSPLTFVKGRTHKIPYCFYTVKSNAKNSGWDKPSSKAVCTQLRAPSDPNQ